ncbi:DUF6314 family protein [Loktanella sp. S4079]|uniref:DUF6314 family protein n=1 Tax=Loktanella sp. S4079 TaxID=579483 RepID=UPI0005FA84A4|nr:DUF6314 family protein [Loktanella sp. S4079]KJZ20353.1 hypothetical protein TW80_05985 [Loktanella sp. S4079]
MTRMLESEDFKGHWRLSRVITDRLSNQTGRLSGTAEFQDVGAGRLLYIEEGELRFGNAPPMAAKRQYLWLFHAGGVDVQFEDETAFHSFTPAGRPRGTDHPCGADIYQVQYDFSVWPEWQASWQVSGPRKDYTSVSQYRR